jgi:hypothetical protein
MLNGSDASACCMPSRRTTSPSSARRRRYNLLKVEISHTRELKNDPTGSKITVGVVGNNLLNDDIRNHVSYTKDQVLMRERACGHSRA